jgi:hypothetical protein
MPPAAFLTLMLAQAPQVEAGEGARIDRIRKALTEAPAIAVPTVTRAEGPVFRVTVQGHKPVEPLWKDRSGTPAYVRTWFQSYHHEFLEQVTKEEFRGATLYPIGIDIVQVGQFLAKHIKAANRKRGDASAKEEVRQALEDFLACRADPSRPGC